MTINNITADVYSNSNQDILTIYVKFNEIKESIRLSFNLNDEFDTLTFKAYSCISAKSNADITGIDAILTIPDDNFESWKMELHIDNKAYPIKFKQDNNSTTKVIAKGFWKHGLTFNEWLIQSEKIAMDKFADRAMAVDKLKTLLNEIPNN